MRTTIIKIGLTLRRLLSLFCVVVLLLTFVVPAAHAQESAGDDTGLGTLGGLRKDNDRDNDGDEDCTAANLDYCAGTLRGWLTGDGSGGSEDGGDGTPEGANDPTLGKDEDHNNDGTADEEEDTDGDGVADGKDKDPEDASDNGGEDHENKEPGEGIEKAEGPDGETDAWGGITGVLTSAVRAAGVLGILIGCCVRAASAQNTDGVALGNKIITAAVGGLAVGLLAPGIYDLFFQWAPIGGGG